jgi:hypothetical protein
MQVEPMIAFRNEEYEPPGLEVLVNFGVFAGREATPAEIDELAHAILPLVGDISIVSEQRHEIGDHVEASLHQVRIEVAEDHLPENVDMLADRVVAKAELWALACIAERHAEVTEI